MSQIGLLHVWSDASCQLQDCFDCLQALNLNCIYESNILVLIWYIPDIFHKKDLSSVSSAWMISSLWKLVYTKVHNLGKRYMHWNQQKDSFCQEGIYLEYTWDISLPHIWQVYTRNIPYIRYYADSRCHWHWRAWGPRQAGPAMPVDPLMGASVSVVPRWCHGGVTEVPRWKQRGQVYSPVAFTV